MLYFLFAFLTCISLYAVDVKQLTLEQKVGQLIIAHFNGEIANEDAKTLIQEVGVGGIIYYEWANGLHSPNQVRKLSTSLQQLAQIPLFIAVDQEGGVVNRLNQGFTVFPGNWALGVAGDAKLAEACAYAMGIELSAVGINVNCAPVIDVNCNPANPVIGVRSFGSTPEHVMRFGQAAQTGYHRAGIITSLKHFPGHGDVSVDSHELLPVVHKSKEQLQRVELYPYTRLTSKADMVMTAHILLPELDPENCATFSSHILNRLLREEIGYQGVVISDSLMMEGLLKIGSSIEEVTLRAFNAGCDVLLLGGKQLVGANKGFELTTADIKRIHRFLVDAVKTGRMSEDRLNQSVSRIIALKGRYPLTETSHGLEVVHSKEHQQLAHLVADLSVAVHQNRLPTTFSLHNKKMLVVSPTILLEDMKTLPTLKEAQHLAFTFNQPSVEESSAILKSCQEAEVVVVCSYNAWKFGEQQALIQFLLALKKPTVVICARDPQDAVLFPQAQAVLKAYGPTPSSLRAVVHTLMSLNQMDKIAHHIWQNECGGKEEVLTHWGKGEHFASLGIGHFIWYPENERKMFDETFPDFVAFLCSHGQSVPAWLMGACPWKTRDEFYSSSSQEKILALRAFLIETKPWQVQYMAKRLKHAVPQMVETLSLSEQTKVIAHFQQLAEDSQGLYALIDYANFKGIGTSLEERYQGQGWGLLQVLLAMPDLSQQPTHDFAIAAKKLLTERVNNAPAERKEERWLKGWINRVNSYIKQ